MQQVSSCLLRLRLWGIPKNLLEDIPLPWKSLQSWEKDEPSTPRLGRGQSKGSCEGSGEAKVGGVRQPGVGTGLHPTTWGCAPRGEAWFCFQCFVILHESVLTFKYQEIPHMGQVAHVSCEREGSDRLGSHSLKKPQAARATYPGR